MTARNEALAHARAREAALAIDVLTRAGYRVTLDDGPTRVSIQRPGVWGWLRPRLRARGGSLADALVAALEGGHRGADDDS